VDLDDNEIRASIRSRARRVLFNLEAQVVDDDDDDDGNDDDDDGNDDDGGGNEEGQYGTEKMTGTEPCSDGNDDEKRRQWHRKRQRQFFDRHGFLLIESFADDTISTDEVFNMKLQMKNLVEERWNPNDDEQNPADNNNKGDNNKKTNKKKLSIFSTNEKEQLDEQGSDDYFLESANAIHFFAEPTAIDEKSPTGGLRPEFTSDKISALNKAGHGLHTLTPSAFHSYTTSPRVRSLVRDTLGYIDPVVPQSMYIFKQARIGGEVTSHQDSTFLYTTPRQTCLGMWLALDDSTLENGCLWVRPGSHGEEVRRRFGRNPGYFGEGAIEARSNVAVDGGGDLKETKLIFTDEGAGAGSSSGSDGRRSVPWEGKVPGGDTFGTGSATLRDNGDSLFDAGFVPIECKAGDLIVFPGHLDHLSLPNYSDAPRHTFQLHLVEGEDAGVTWAKSNWLQYPKGVPFLSI